MGRPPLPLGSWGRINRTQLAPGRWQARARFRDFDGVTRPVKAHGPTGAAAERRLVAALTERTTAPTGGEITQDTKVAVLVALWLAERERLGRAQGTLTRYHEAVTKHVLPGVGSIRVREATPSHLDRFLSTTADRSGPATARMCRTILSGTLAIAVRAGALNSNPVRDVGPLPTSKPEPRALSEAEVVALREGIRQWQEAGQDRPGPPRAPDLLDVLDVFLGTGARIGEVLALRWADVDLEAEQPTLTVRGTVVSQRGGGLVIQEHPKSEASWRRLVLPRFVVATLLRRRVNARPNPYDVVFPGRQGKLRSPANLRRQLREAREAAGFAWVTPHTFRRTVATLLDAERTTRAAASQLGHVDERITRTHYIQRSHEGPDVADVLERFADPDSRSGILGP